MKFNPCTGACTDDGTHCKGCDRTHEDIAAMRSLVGDVVSFAQEKGYDNPEEFAESFGKNVRYKLLNA